MKRYIDANKLKKSLYIPYASIIKISDAIMAQIDAQQTANVRENVKGEWIKVKDDVFFHYECSVCRAKPLYEEFCDLPELSDFCPNCGADMRGKV